MPYKKYYRRYRKKRSYRRFKKWKGKRRKLKSRNKISSLRLYKPSALPDNVFVKMKYVDFITMTNIAGLGTYTFRMNSLFDPDLTGTGHQPMAFDQWSAFYQTYEVLASRITVQLLPPDTNVVGFAIYPSNSPTAASTYSSAREQPYAKGKWISSATSLRGAIVSNYMKIKKLEARSTNSVNFVANVSQNPSSTRWWHLVLQSVSGTDISDIRLDIRITFYARMFRRQQLGQS